MNWKPKTIVVPIDFSGQSKPAIEAALEIASDPGDVHLVHVLYPLDSVSPGVVLGDVTEEEREQGVRKSADKLLKENNIAGVNVAVRFGNPGLEIADFATSIDADLIIIPSHGYSGVRRLILGSVAERVIRHAGCSVMVLRRSDTE